MMISNLQHLLRASLHRIHRWGFDNLMDDVLGLEIASLPDGQEVTTLPVMTRFEIYRTIWNAAIEACYDRFIPAQKVHMALSHTPEVTAYTITLCGMVPLEDRRAALERMLRNDPEPELCLEPLTGAVGENNLPEAEEDKLLLFLRLLNFPPLRELWKLHYFLYSEEEQISDLLADAFLTRVRATNLSFTGPEALMMSVFPLPQEFFEKTPAAQLAEHPALGRFQGALSDISNDSAPREITLKRPLILPECGHTIQVATKPRSALEHEAIFRDFELGCAVALSHLGEARTHIMQSWWRSFEDGFKSLNDVKHPDCLLLVEGDSEEALLPLLATRLDLSLRSARVRVHNSGSKQKLKDDFFKLRKNTPDLPMVALLDHDAQHEAADIARAIEGEHERYLVTLLQRGELEDEFPIATSVTVLNRLYGGGIVESDFDPSKPFVKSASHVLWDRKKVKFDKVKFSSTMALTVEKSSVPESLLAAIKGARLRASAFAISRREKRG